MVFWARNKTTVYTQLHVLELFMLLFLLMSAAFAAPCFVLPGRCNLSFVATAVRTKALEVDHG